MSAAAPHRLSKIAEFWLLADGDRHALSQVAPDFVILRKPTCLRQGPATLFIEVEGHQEQRSIQLLPTEVGAATYLPIGRD